MISVSPFVDRWIRSDFFSKWLYVISWKTGLLIGIFFFSICTTGNGFLKLYWIFKRISSGMNKKKYESQMTNYGTRAEYWEDK